MRLLKLTNGHISDDKIIGCYSFLDTVPNPDVYRINVTYITDGEDEIDATLSGEWATQAEADAVIGKMFHVVDAADF